MKARPLGPRQLKLVLSGLAPNDPVARLLKATLELQSATNGFHLPSIPEMSEKYSTTAILPFQFACDLPGRRRYRNLLRRALAYGRRPSGRRGLKHSAHAMPEEALASPARGQRGLRPLD